MGLQMQCIFLIKDKRIFIHSIKKRDAMLKSICKKRGFDKTGPYYRVFDLNKLDLLNYKKKAFKLYWDLNKSADLEES